MPRCTPALVLSALFAVVAPTALMGRQEQPPRPRDGVEASKPTKVASQNEAGGKPAKIAPQNAEPSAKPAEAGQKAADAGKTGDAQKAVKPAAPKENAEPHPARPPQADLEISVVPVARADARELLGILKQMAGSIDNHANVTVDENTNSLIIAAEHATVPRILELINSLDRPSADHKHDGLVCRSITLSNALAFEVGAYLEELAKLRKSAVRIFPDKRANVVWIGGDEQVVETLAKIAGDMDAARPSDHAASPGAERPELRFYTLKHADPVRLSDTVNRVAAEMSMSAMVVADSQSGMLIAYATTPQSSELEKIIARLDIPGRKGETRGGDKGDDMKANK